MGGVFFFFFFFGGGLVLAEKQEMIMTVAELNMNKINENAQTNYHFKI